ncbi:MAG: hypothetical protein CMJ83_06505, partial [Planctomycetes bacterium]|nr:hypothetical protein [Planctomycetota bacterium]
SAKENVDHLGFLLELCEIELLEREKRAAARRLPALEEGKPSLPMKLTFDASGKCSEITPDSTLRR